MARIEASTHIAAPTSRVWDRLTDWEAQAEWMTDVRSLEVRSAHRQGIGVTVRLRTDIALGVVVTDELTTTEWRVGERLGVRHSGPLYSAVGAFELEATPTGTLITWWDELRVPLGTLGDAAVGLLVVPFARRVFRHSLANFKALCERPARRL